MAFGLRHLSEHSLVVIPSRSGDTAESLDVLDYCQRAGAKVLARHLVLPTRRSPRKRT